ncbi:MAG: hypothetical protein Q9204_002120 [Flavoplaca sp. TL-2023a]
MTAKSYLIQLYVSSLIAYQSAYVLFEKIAEKFEDVIGDKKKHEETYEAKHADPPLPETLMPYTTRIPPARQELMEAMDMINMQQGYGAPPPSRPSFPPGWVSQWDQNSQLTYYLEQAAGLTLWDLPQAQHGGPPPLMGGGDGSVPGHGVPGGSYSQQYNQYNDSHGNQHRALHEKKGEEWAMILTKNAPLNNDRLLSKRRNDYQDGGRPMAPPPGADHDSLSISDKEDMQEAREDYENASASDKESARDEYEEQYEDLDLR